MRELPGTKKGKRRTAPLAATSSVEKKLNPMPMMLEQRTGSLGAATNVVKKPELRMASDFSTTRSRRVETLAAGGATRKMKAKKEDGDWVPLLANPRTVALGRAPQQQRIGPARGERGFDGLILDRQNGIRMGPSWTPDSPILGLHRSNLTRVLLCWVGPRSAGSYAEECEMNSGLAATKKERNNWATQEGYYGSRIGCLFGPLLQGKKSKKEGSGLAETEGGLSREPNPKSQGEEWNMEGLVFIIEHVAKTMEPSVKYFKVDCEDGLKEEQLSDSYFVEFEKEVGESFGHGCEMSHAGR
ncbi:unnamed protein product [Linum trigynum]|uniref:Uncharacterized protein n=1 Tax=Linum trigynum TaxID=586398 RepID=A0AAV2F670_9ROSI